MPMATFLNGELNEFAPFHRVALTGDCEQLASMIAKHVENGKKLPINEPDEQGNSAMFYAQLCGHTAVADLLNSHGYVPAT